MLLSFLSRNTFTRKLPDIDLLYNNVKEQGNTDLSLSEREALVITAEKRFLLELKRLSDTQNFLLKFEQALCKREKAVEQLEQGVAERERAVAVFMEEVHKKAADLSAQECSIKEKTQLFENLDIQMKTTAQELQSERQIISKEKMDLHEQRLQIEAKQKGVESQLLLCKRQKEELKEEWEKIQEQRSVDAKEREATMEKEEMLADKELALRDMEKDLDGKVLAVESLSRKLNAREKLLTNIQKQSKEERLQIGNLMAVVESEKKSLEEAKQELEISKQNANETWEHINCERQEAAEYMKSVDEKMTAWEDRLKEQEKELLQQHKFLMEFESKIKREQQHCHMLHSKIQKEQERMAEDQKMKEENLKDREAITERKEDELKNGLQKLNEKRNLADVKLMQLKKRESRAESLEEELHKCQQEHLQKVDWHAKEYQAQLEHLETLEHNLQQKSMDVDRKFQEVRIAKKELKAWQKEAEEALDNQAENFLKEKQELESQKQHLKNFQHEIERTGAQIIEHVMNLDQASAKLELLRHRIDASRQRVQVLVSHISEQQKLLKEKEKDLHAKDQELKRAQNEWEKRNKDSIAKEGVLVLKEQELKSREGDLNDLESKFKIEKENQQKIEKQSEHKKNIGMDRENTNSEEKMEIREHLESFQIELQKQADGRDVHEMRREHQRDRQEESSNIEIFHQEAARFIKERENLKAQQHELEETKNAVQDAKLTLAAQLRATKEMVVDASITAQKASREREALEQERKRLAKAQKDIDVALAAREAKLSLEQQKLDKDRRSLKEERQRAMDIICKAEQMKKLVETSSNTMNHLELSTDAAKAMLGLRDNEPFEQCSQVLQNKNARFDLDMINLWREEECAKIEKEEKMIMDEISRLQNQHQDRVDNTGVNSMSDELEVSSLSGFKGTEKENFLFYQRGIGSGLEALQLQGSCDTQSNKFFHTMTDNPLDGFFSGSEPAFANEMRQHNEPLDLDEENDDTYFDEINPSQNRLENVMTSLVNARQASRGRLQRTQNLLNTLPISGRLASEVQQALGTLTDRLSLMEQMEDELTDELRNAYGIDLPDSEGMIVDKVELLCRMEEQQTLRAEWEGDMQCQLEKISMLQSNPQASSCFSTPVKHTIFERIISPPTTNQSLR